MSAPILHVLAGPNGSGKSTFVMEILGPATGLPFINADVIAAERWPGDEERHAYEASRAAAAARAAALESRASFITETVFSHESKVALVEDAVKAGYRVHLHVMLVPEDVAVARVTYRVEDGGHTVPESKIRSRYRRLWALIAEARQVAHRASFYDNSTAAPYRLVADYVLGEVAGEAHWPVWTPIELTRGV